MVVFDYTSETSQAYNDFKQWKHGYVFIKRITFKNATAISNYFTKYLGKENQIIDSGKKIYSTSKNLKQSEKYSHVVYDYLIKKYNYDVDIKTFDFDTLDIVDMAKVLFGIDKVKIKE